MEGSNTVTLGVIKVAALLAIAFVLAPYLAHMRGLILIASAAAIIAFVFRGAVEEHGLFWTIFSIILWCGIAAGWLYLVVGYFVLHNVSDLNAGIAFIGLSIISALQGHKPA